METTVVLNNVLKTNIAIITYFFGIKNKLYTILFVAMVTKFNYFLSLFYDVVAMATTGCTK